MEKPVKKNAVPLTLLKILLLMYIITGILLFCMLGCEFFINFRLIFRKKGHKVQKEAAQ